MRSDNAHAAPRWSGAKESVLASTNIVELIGQTVPLKRQGADYVGLCPFHEETTPSFHVSPAKRFFHCFGCRAHGNAIDFVMRRDRLGFVDAIRSLSRGGNLPPRFISPPTKLPRPERAPQPPTQDLTDLHRSFLNDVNPARVQSLAQALGLSAPSLDRLGIGWAGQRWCRRCERRCNAWSFPMVDAAGKVRGLRLRFVECAHKSAVLGGHEGLFIPNAECGVRNAECESTSRLFICEGPTDTAAMLDLGLDAIGRPSCTGGLALIVELLKARHAQRQAITQLVIVADADAPGQRGAAALAGIARLYCPIVQIVTPPAGIKDARAWKNNGATAADIERAVWAAPRRQLKVVSASARTMEGTNR